jgi:hypothetical protein
MVEENLSSEGKSIPKKRNWNFSEGGFIKLIILPYDECYITCAADKASLNSCHFVPKISEWPAGI